MKKGAIISIVSTTIFLAVLLLVLAFDPIFAAIGPIGFTQETLGQEIRDEAANRYKMMTYHGRYQEQLGMAIRNNSEARLEWNAKAGVFQEELGKVIRDDAVLRQIGAGNMQEELGRALVSVALLDFKLVRTQEELGVAIRDEASTKYDTMTAMGKYQERLGKAIKMDAVTRLTMAKEVVLNQEEQSVPVGEDNALPYTSLMLVGMTIAAAASFFFSWAICPQHEGEKAEEEEEISKAA
jgi:hypothetical protein